jgi:hypothetical protein
MLPQCPKCGEPFYFEDIKGWCSEAFNKIDKNGK